MWDVVRDERLTVRACAPLRSRRCIVHSTFYIVHCTLYILAGASYIVDELDLEKRVALMHREDVGYYTEPRDHTRVLILNRSEPHTVYGCSAYHGPMRVSKQVYGYRMCNRLNSQLMELCDAERPLPPHEFDTRGLWLEMPSELRAALDRNGHSYARGGLHALEHLAIGLAPLCATCEPTDLGCQCTRRLGDEHAERCVISPLACAYKQVQASASHPLHTDKQV